MGNGWQIEPPGVQAALTGTETAATNLSTAFDGLADAHAALTTAVGDDQAVAGAVAALIESHSALLTRVGNHITAGLAGAANATLAYYHGDEEMAATAQANAIRASSTGDFTGVDLAGDQ
ncbi:hypothetical protein GCM10017714_09720 [Curtobacterium pusillum]|uniref:ESX-1 secretion-associated protein n=1 Tax=Curtobacterium pusillum TaxID=69373 RepID=A0ABX2M5J7_9MICO|nr:DUF6507 family protein [Curtobacterium pusillum]NUU12768.1 hypothetical protein [Curtobacterium pusillum]GLK30234.1 hypothetical protein GCM10017610_05190 [Curtobacterium pusillum]